MEQIFKQCPSCHETWSDYTEFLADPCLQLIGYQVLFEDLADGLFLFNHSCGTTMSVTVADLQHLYNGPIYIERVTDSERCPGLCLLENDTRPCPVECDCAYVRAIMQTIKKWHKEDICLGAVDGKNLLQL